MLRIKPATTAVAAAAAPAEGSEPGCEQPQSAGKAGSKRTRGSRTGTKEGTGAAEGAPHMLLSSVAFVNVQGEESDAVLLSQIQHKY